MRVISESSRGAVRCLQRVCGDDMRDDYEPMGQGSLAGLSRRSLNTEHIHSRSFSLLPRPSARLASPWNGVMSASLTILNVLLELANVAVIGSRASLS